LVVMAVLVGILIVSNILMYSSLQNQVNTLTYDKNNLQSQLNSQNGTFQNYAASHSHSNTEYDALQSLYNNYVATHHHTDSEYDILKLDYTLAFLPNLDYSTQALLIIKKANETIDVAMYSMAYYVNYTSDYSNILLEAIVAAKNRGVNVRVLVDDNTMTESLNSLQSIIYLQNNGVSVKLDKNKSVTTHTKMVIVDNTFLFVGSHNWSYEGLQKNNEYSVMIKGDLSNAIQYFQDLWNNGRTI